MGSEDRLNLRGQTAPEDRHGPPKTDRGPEVSQVIMDGQGIKDRQGIKDTTTPSFHAIISDLNMEICKSMDQSQMFIKNQAKKRNCRVNPWTNLVSYDNV